VVSEESAVVFRKAESSILDEHNARLAHASGIFIEIKPKVS
jgi:hypothetical protein